MIITFRTPQLQRLMSSQRLSLKEYGKARSKILGRRLDDLRAAPSLLEMRNLPGRCHELGGVKAGQFSIDLDGPYRLIFEPDHDPIPVKADGGIDWSEVTVIRILEIEDTHG